MIPNLPRKIKVLGVPYTVVEAPHADSGCTGIDGQHITIHPTQAPDQLRRTLLHECLHAVCEGSGLSKWIKEADSEEFLVSVLDSALYQLCRDNPRLVEFLTER